MKDQVSRGVSLIAHRGWSKFFPENSIPAFAAAIAAGADEIEFDVRSSRDRIPMICHDASTDRVSNLSGELSSFTSSELCSAGIKYGETILIGLGFPTLHDVLSNFYDKITMNIHIKELDADRTALHLLRSLDTALEYPVYIAGNPEILQEALITCPHIPRCLIQGTKDTKMDIVFRNAALLKCSRIQFFKGFYEDRDIQIAIEKGFIPNLFWEDEPEDAEKAIHKGITGLLTNDIGLIRTHLKKQLI